MNLQLNDIELSTGAFVSKLVTTRVNYNFNTRMFFNALVQHNSDNHQWTSNLRFNVIHRPLSDFFLVYNERRDERTGQMLSRAVIAKMTLSGGVLRPRGLEGAKASRKNINTVVNFRLCTSYLTRSFSLLSMSQRTETRRYAYSSGSRR